MQTTKYASHHKKNKKWSRIVMSRLIPRANSIAHRTPRTKNNNSTTLTVLSPIFMKPWSLKFDKKVITNTWLLFFLVLGFVIPGAESVSFRRISMRVLGWHFGISQSFPELYVAEEELLLRSKIGRLPRHLTSTSHVENWGWGELLLMLDNQTCARSNLKPMLVDCLPDRRWQTYVNRWA